MPCRRPGECNPEAARGCTCRTCGESGLFASHGGYVRHVVHWRDGRAVESSVRLSRVRCTRCGATHALIPTSLVAYSPYSVLLCVHVVLLVRASRGLSREAAARFHASLTTCRRLASDAARLAEALDCAISSLGAELAAACRDACALAERFAARHGTTPFSAVPLASARSGAGPPTRGGANEARRAH